MKNISKHISLFLLTIGLLVTGGCKKYLDQQPDDRTELNNPVKVAELLATAYPQANYIPFTEAMSDNAGDKGTSDRKLENSLPWSYTDNPGEDEDTPSYYWAACYKAIASANLALETIDKASDKSAYAASKGEALIARAYAHFMLVTLFSKAYDPTTAANDVGIPYVTTPSKVVEEKYERKTVAYVYAQIEKDLLEGLPLLKDNTYRVPKYHFTTVAAHAFAARFYLFKRDYQKVVDHANAILPVSTIASSLRAWNTTYDNLTYYELQAIYTNSTEPANLLLVETKSNWDDQLAYYNFGLNSQLLTSVLGTANPLKVALVMQSNVYGGTEVVYNIPKFAPHFVKESISASFGDNYNMIPLFSAEEVLFNRAEANANLGNNNDVLADLNAYLSKRIVNYNATTHAFTVAKATSYYTASPDVKSALIESILNYKRQEYIFEGLRWFDIIRLKIPVVHQYTQKNGGQTITLAPDDPRRLLQLPKEVVQAGISLNPR